MNCDHVCSLTACCTFPLIGYCCSLPFNMLPVLQSVQYIIRYIKYSSQTDNVRLTEIAAQQTKTSSSLSISLLLSLNRECTSLFFTNIKNGLYERLRNVCNMSPHFSYCHAPLQLPRLPACYRCGQE
jgi:hypothetical protein